MKKKMIYDSLPDIIKAVLLNSYGWLVGSSPGTLISGGVIIKDYDIIVENRELFQEVVKFLSASGFVHSVNSFGGSKFNNGEIKMDIWCEEIGHFLQTTTQETGYIYNYRRSKLLQII